MLHLSIPAIDRQSCQSYLLQVECLRHISRGAFNAGTKLRKDVERNGGQSDNHGELDGHSAEEIPPWMHHVILVVSQCQVERLVVVGRHGEGTSSDWGGGGWSKLVWQLVARYRNNSFISFVNEWKPKRKRTTND